MYNMGLRSEPPHCGLCWVAFGSPGTTLVYNSYVRTLYKWAISLYTLARSIPNSTYNWAWALSAQRTTDHPTTHPLTHPTVPNKYYRNKNKSVRLFIGKTIASKFQASLHFDCFFLGFYSRDLVLCTESIKTLQVPAANQSINYSEASDPYFLPNFLFFALVSIFFGAVGLK